MTTILSLLSNFFAQGIVVVYPGVLVFWLILHTNIERWRKVGKRAYWISAAGWPLTAGPILFFRSEIFSGRWFSLPAAGILMFLLAIAFSMAAYKVMPARTLVGLPELEPHKNSQPLLNTGIYSRTRNPIYFVHWLLVLSAAAMTGYAANWMLFALDSLALPLVIRAEERELRGRYGSQFTDYMRRVPRFFPKLT